MSAGTPDPPDEANREQAHDFDIRWPWNRPDRMRSGTTVVLRVKNEARSLPWVLPPLLRSVDETVLVDNASDDGTPEVARSVAETCGHAERLLVTSYPFRVSRCGPEHLHTAPDSVHSLTWFYNWSFSHVTTTYSVKWDGDMVLTRDGEALMRDLAWMLPGHDVVLYVHRHSLYVESDRVAYLDLGLHNAEPFGYPMSPSYPHVKAFEWELRVYPDEARSVRLPEGSAVELKWLDADEFAHWTSSDAFAESGRTRRKRREWELFRALSEGRWEDQRGIRRIESPAGVHVIDHVTQTWLPQATRPLVDRSHEEPRAARR